MLFDNHDRKIDYLRLAVTDRCNLRCLYCMPSQGITYVDRSDLLTYEEMERIVRLFGTLGVSKVRITGGEPFLRKGLMDFLERLRAIPEIEGLHMTTNGTLTLPFISRMAKTLNSVNLSLDSLDKERFAAITRRDDFEKVMKSLDAFLDNGIPTKINMVVMNGRNIEDIVPMINFTKDRPISVRFLEEMPFNGTGWDQELELWNHVDILQFIENHFGKLERLTSPNNSTSVNYTVPGFAGSIGIIASYTRSFCGTCNRIRLTPTGTLKTCLYDNGIFNIRDLIRQGASDPELVQALQDALGNRAIDGFEAERRRSVGSISESMATIGG